MTDNQAALLGLLLVLGLFVAYGIERRKKRLARRPRPADVVQAGDAATPGPSEPASPADSAGPGSVPAPAEVSAPILGDGRPSRSVDYGCLPLLTSFLLLLVATHRDDGWGYLWQGVFLLIVAYSAYSTLSPKEFAAARRWDPERTWTAHLLQVGVGLVLLPLLGWVLVVFVGWDPGFLVPAVPWALLLVVAYCSSAFRRRT